MRERSPCDQLTEGRVPPGSSGEVEGHPGMVRESGGERERRGGEGGVAERGHEPYFGRVKEKGIRSLPRPWHGGGTLPITRAHTGALWSLPS